MTCLTPSPTRGIAATLLALGLAACGSPTTQGGVRTTPAPATGGQTDFTYIAKAQADSARYPYTAADIHFMSGMISHHAQAIKMAAWAPTHGAGASVQRLASRIINAQQDEIGIMRQWLRDRRQPVPEASPTGMRMMVNGVEHEMLMPGMLTEAQMKQLEQARGTDFDRLFLGFMIQHHKGAVSMVSELFSTDGAGQDEMVFKFASDVNIDQTTEIARMETMLAAYGPERNSP